jgi:hypothetical protein
MDVKRDTHRARNAYNIFYGNPPREDHFGLLNVDRAILLN